MATDTDNKPASTENIVTESDSDITAKVGDGGKVSGRRRKLSAPKPKLPFKGVKKRKLVLYLLILIVVVVGGWLLLTHVFKVGQKVYAQADGHKVYKQEVEDLIDGNKNISVHQAASVLADKYLYQAMVQQAGITITNKDLVSEYPSINAKSTSKFLRQSETNNVYYGILAAYNTGYYKGEVIVAYFSRYIPFQSSLLEQQKSENPLIGNQQAMNNDKKYAYNFINKIYNELKSKKISFNQAIQTERNDPQLGVNAYSELPHSGPFDTSNVFLGGTNLIGPQSAQPELAKIKQGQLSKPFVVSVRNSLTDSSVTAQAYYLVVQMDYSRSSHSGLTFDQWLAKEKKQYDYKVNA